MSRNVDVHSSKHRYSARGELNSLTVEHLEPRCMLDGDWTLVSYQSTLDDFGQVISEVFEYDFTGDETADVQSVYKYTNDGIPGWPQTEITTDYGIDGTIDGHFFQWWTSSSEGLIDHFKSASDSDGDGVFDRFHHESMRLHLSEVQDYLDPNIIYHRSISVSDANNLLQSRIEEIDDNGDGVLDRRDSTYYQWDEFEGNSLLTSVINEIDQGADGSLDYRSTITYEYGGPYGTNLLSITTEIDENGDGLIDSTTVFTFPPTDDIEDGTGIEGEDGGAGDVIEPGEDADPGNEADVGDDVAAGEDSNGSVDEVSGTDGEPNAEIEDGDGASDAPGSLTPPLELTSPKFGEIQISCIDTVAGTIASPAAELSTGIDGRLSESIDWLAYQTTIDANAHDLFLNDLESSFDVLPLNLASPTIVGAEPSVIVAQAERHFSTLDRTPIVLDAIVPDSSTRKSASNASATEAKTNVAIR